MGNFIIIWGGASDIKKIKPIDITNEKEIVESLSITDCFHKVKKIKQKECNRIVIVKSDFYNLNNEFISDIVDNYPKDYVYMNYRDYIDVKYDDSLIILDLKDFYKIKKVLSKEHEVEQKQFYEIRTLLLIIKGYLIQAIKITYSSFLLSIIKFIKIYIKNKKITRKIDGLKIICEELKKRQIETVRLHFISNESVDTRDKIRLFLLDAGLDRKVIFVRGEDCCG